MRLSRAIPRKVTARPPIITARYLPDLLTQTPLAIDEPNSPNMRGRLDNPLVVADTPCASCWNSGRNATVLMKAMETRNPARFAVQNTRFLKSAMGRIGSDANRSAKT